MSTAHAPANPEGPFACSLARLRGDEGSVSTEIALTYMPLMVLAALAIIACLRLVSADSDVHAAAAAAARQASLARTPAGAVAGGQDAAAATLQGRKMTCLPHTTSVNTGDMAPGGQVSVTVVCTVHLEDLFGLGLPGAMTLQGTASQPVDRYIGRALGFGITEGTWSTNPRVGDA
ncbi:hypothetical protein ACFP2T_27810 [Plantactinospora solaniradicis]|uniref:Pilus assembly protein TadE n=1 Tax=Plantactinospora solaniradicis TaxID=1723736 RepID=A0ABW1KGE5_9ACTN